VYLKFRRSLRPAGIVFVLLRTHKDIRIREVNMKMVKGIYGKVRVKKTATDSPGWKEIAKHSPYTLFDGNVSMGTFATKREALEALQRREEQLVPMLGEKEGARTVMRILEREHRKEALRQARETESKSE